MEFLKAILDEELYAQVAEKIKGSSIKLADLSKGEYVGIGKLTAVETKAAGLETQLSEANKQIESFKGMDIEGIKKAANDWKDTAKKAKEEAELAAKQAQEEAEAKILGLQFDYALERALLNAKVKDPKIIAPLIKKDKLKLTEDEIVGLKEQLEPLTESHSYLFDIEGEVKLPPLNSQKLNQQNRVKPPIEGIFTKESISKMTPAEINKNWDKIKPVLSQKEN